VGSFVLGMRRNLVGAVMVLLGSKDYADAPVRNVERRVRESRFLWWEIRTSPQLLNPSVVEGGAASGGRGRLVSALRVRRNASGGAQGDHAARQLKTLIRRAEPRTRELGSRSRPRRPCSERLAEIVSSLGEGARPRSIAKAAASRPSRTRRAVDCQAGGAGRRSRLEWEESRRRHQRLRADFAHARARRHRRPRLQ
jgi:hypothetical protein